MIERGSFNQIIEEDPGFSMMNKNKIEAFEDLFVTPRQWKSQVLVFWGATGTGKSKYANEIAPNAYWKTPDTKWFDGYRGQEDIIIDDFTAATFSRDFMLRFLDRYPMKVECKGGHREMVAKRIIITSNFHPNEWWKEKDGDTTGNAALMRRIDVIKYFMGPQTSFAESDDALLDNTELLRLLDF